MAVKAPRQSSGASGPAYAKATPRQDPGQTSGSGGPSTKEKKQAWEAYDGNFTGPLTQMPGQPDMNVLSNRISAFVRTGVDFLFGPALKIQHQNGAAQKILDKVWGNEDQKMMLLAKLRINGGVYGQAITKIVTPRNKKPMSLLNPPRLVVQNPEMYHIETQPDDCDTVECYECVWMSTDDAGEPCQMRQTTLRKDPDDPQGIEENNRPDDTDDADAYWEIQNWLRSGGEGEAWQPVGPVILWNYEFPPVCDWQNYPNPNDHWGARDVDDGVVNLNKQLHLVESDTAAQIHSQSFPYVFSSGADTSAMTPTPGSVTDLGSPDAKVWAVSAAGDTAQMMAFAQQLRENMDEATATPGVALGRMTELPRGQISGITIRLLFGSRIMRTEHERRLYGQGIRDICRRVLILCGEEAAAEDDVQLTWQDPLPQDDLAMAQMALALQQLGLSDHTVYSLIGQNYEVEQQYKLQEADDKQRAAAAGLTNPPVPAGFPSLAAPGADGSGTPPPPATQQAPAVGGNMPPPVNHPAAVQQRNALKAAAASIKANAKLHG